MNKELPKIMYDQTQYTALWMLAEKGVYLNAESYFGMKKISGYAPDVWTTYTQNKPVSFFFGAYDQEALKEEARVGFENFTDKQFLKEFEDAVENSYLKSKKLKEVYFENFYKKEKDALESKPSEVIDFLNEVRSVTTYVMSYYFLTQPQRFYKFDDEIKSFLPNKSLETISTNGRHLTYVSKLQNEIINFANSIHQSGEDYDTYIKNNQDKYTSLKEEIERLGFLNWGFFGGEFIDEDYARKEIKDFISNHQKLSDEMKKISELTSQIDARNNLIRENLSKEFQMADIMGHSSVLRFDLQTCMLCLLKYADNFIKRAQEKHSLSSEEIASYYYDEILEIIKKGTKVDGFEIEKRQEGFLVMWKQDGVKTYLSSDAHTEIKDLLEFRANEIKMTQEVKGSVASYPDKNTTKIKGRAFVLTSAFDTEEELKKFQDGDILVSTQTHPNLVPQMKKAIAIVTDEGGITCHAAIVSRELGKPCIIGTKLSSKIFKTGDLIELDLQTGVVRKSM